MGTRPERPTPKTKERLEKLEAIMKSKRKAKPVYFCGEYFWKWNEGKSQWEIVTE